MPGPVNKRASLPGASELFRTTNPEPEPSVAEKQPAKRAPSRRKPRETPAATGRVRHDHKITVYFSADELFALEDATLELRRSHGLALDRGRLVRTAVALALADLADHGADSAVVDALRSQ